MSKKFQSHGNLATEGNFPGSLLGFSEWGYIGLAGRLCNFSDGGLSLTEFGIEIILGIGSSFLILREFLG